MKNSAVHMLKPCFVCLQQNVIVCPPVRLQEVTIHDPQTAARCPALNRQRTAGRSVPCPPSHPNRPSRATAAPRQRRPRELISTWSSVLQRLPRVLQSCSAWTGRLKKHQEHQTLRRRSSPSRWRQTLSSHTWIASLWRLSRRSECTSGICAAS